MPSNDPWGNSPTVYDGEYGNKLKEQWETQKGWQSQWRDVPDRIDMSGINQQGLNYLQQLQNQQWGYSPEQLNTMYQSAMRRMMPQYQQMFRQVNDVYGGRGLYDSGMADAARGNVSQAQSNAMSDWWSNMMAQNKQMQNQGMQYAYGALADYQQNLAAQNQARYNYLASLYASRSR